LLLPLRHQRTEIQVGYRRSHFQSFVSARHSGQHLVMDRAVDEDARAGGAGLPGILDAGVDEEWQRSLEVGVLEYDLRGFSAELQRYRDDVVGRRMLDQLADTDRAGERNVVDARMRRQRRARFLTETRD